MTRKQAEQAVGTEVWTTYSPKMLVSRWLTGPFFFEKITKAGMAMLSRYSGQPIPRKVTMSVAISTVHNRETAISMCPPFYFCGEPPKASAPVEERQPYSL